MENNTAPDNNKRIATEAELQGNAILFAALSYLCPLWLIGLLASPEKDSAFVKNHVNNGILISIASVIAGPLGVIMGYFIPFVGWIFGSVLPVVILIVAILGVVAAVQKEFFTIFGIANSLKIVK